MLIILFLDSEFQLKRYFFERGIIFEIKQAMSGKIHLENAFSIPC